MLLNPVTPSKFYPKERQNMQKYFFKDIFVSEAILTFNNKGLAKLIIRYTYDKILFVKSFQIRI